MYTPNLKYSLTKQGLQCISTLIYIFKFSLFLSLSLALSRSLSLSHIPLSLYISLSSSHSLFLCSHSQRRPRQPPRRRPHALPPPTARRPCPAERPPRPPPSRRQWPSPSPRCRTIYPCRRRPSTYGASVSRRHERRRRSCRR